MLSGSKTTIRPFHVNRGEVSDRSEAHKPDGVGRYVGIGSPPADRATDFIGASPGALYSQSLIC